MRIIWLNCGRGMRPENGLANPSLRILREMAAKTKQKPDGNVAVLLLPYFTDLEYLQNVSVLCALSLVLLIVVCACACIVVPVMCLTLARCSTLATLGKSKISAGKRDGK